MKLLEQKNHVKVSGGLQTTAFKLQMSAKMAKILSDGIYSDKIKAVIRELSTNAFDSHIMAGKSNTPIEITLPTNWSSNFIVEDYGVGLSPDQIENIYTVYGQSDKEDSNDSIGCLGLGSKSIFAYGTKTASIESIFNGVKYSYKAYINDENMPVLTKLGEVNTTQGNGVKITVPVNRSDVYNFTSKAKEVYEFFSPRPNIKGVAIQFDEPDVLVQGDGWQLREHGNSAVAVMGVIGYPITLSDTSLSTHDSKMLRHPFYIDFEIGDLDIEVSREGLSFDIRTKSNILAKLKDIRTKLEALFESELQACKTLWDARLLAHSKSGVLYDYINKSKLKWQGKTLFPTHFGHIALPQKIKYYNSYYSSRKHFTQKDCETVDINSKNIYIRNDLTKGLDTRVHHRVSTSGAASYNRPTVYVVQDDKEQDMLVAELGIDPALIILASSLPKPVPKARVNTGTGVKRGNTHSIMEFSINGYASKMSSYYTNVVKDFDDGGQYFEFNTFRCEYNGQSMRPSEVAKIISTLETCGKKQDPVYAVKTAKIPKLAKAKKPWTEYIGYALGELDGLYSSLQYTNLNDVEETLRKFGGYDYHIGYTRLSLEQIGELAKLTKKKDFLDFAKQISDLIEINKSNSTRKSIESLYNIMGRALPKATATPTDASKLCAKALTTYTLLHSAYPLLGVLANEDITLSKDIAIYMDAK
jgi:hypothetical protein